MTSGNDELTTLRLSTAAFPDRDRVEAFRESFGQAILRIDMEPLERGVLEADMTLRAFCGFGMATGRLSPMRNRHRVDLVDNDDLILVVMQSGFGVLEQRDRSVEIREGQVVLTANDEPAVFTGVTPTRVMNIRLSRKLLAPQIADIGNALLQPVLPDSLALELLKGYARTLNDEQALAIPQLRQVVATHMHDLAAMAIGPTADAREVARGRGVRAARLNAIKADVMANIGDHRLSIDIVAANLGITSRYVRMLFESEGLSFSEFVVAQRLARAHRMLTSPLHLGRTISAIAFECGFSDLSYFNRTFRRRYGVTPSEVRA